MFDRNQVTSHLNQAGFGPAIAEVLCNWYEESKKANLGWLPSPTGQTPLYAMLDDIADNADALCIFVVDNIISGHAQAPCLQWLAHGWLGIDTVERLVSDENLFKNVVLSTLR